MISPPPIEFASLGMWDSLILMVMALVVFGPRRLPLIARQIGKLMYEVRKASNDFKFQMEEELRRSEDADRRKAQAAEQPALALTAESESAAHGTGPAIGATASPEIIAPAAAEPASSEPATSEPVAELPSHAEIDAIFETVEDWPKTPVSSPLPIEAPAVPAAAADTNSGPNQEPIRHG